MSNTIYWGYDTDFTYTSFDLTKSSDSGLTYSALATVTYDTSDAGVFNRQKSLFFYVDGAGAPGDIYRITGTGPLGTSLPATAIAGPASSPECLIIGYVSDARGKVDESMQVIVTTYGAVEGGREDRWVKNPTGIVSLRSAKALGIQNSSFTVYPNSKGIWQVSLIQRTVARVQIPDLKFDLAFEVPEELGPRNVRDIPQIQGGSFYGIFSEETGVPEALTRG